MKDFKIGDYIKGKKENDYNITNEDMLKAEVIEILDDDVMEIKILKHKDKDKIKETYRVENSIEQFDYYNIKITEKNLLDLPIGSKIITNYDIKYKFNYFIKINDKQFKNNDCDILFIDDEDFDLENNKICICGEYYDIIRIEKPTYYTVYRKEEQKSKEMTIKEISKILGYDVKIIKE